MSVKLNSRLDLVERKPLEVTELVRLEKKDGSLVASPISSSRGYYVKKGSGEAALKRKVFERILRRELTPIEKERLGKL